MKCSLIFFFLLWLSGAKAQQEIYWQATVATGEYGLLKTNFLLQQKGIYISGTTAPDAHSRIIGGIKGAFAKSMFQKNGSLMELDSLQLRGDSLTGFFLFEKRKYALQGKQEGNRIFANITGPVSGKIYGRVEATRLLHLQRPADYSLLWKQMKILTEEKIYNKAVLQAKEWKQFCSSMDRFSAVAEDDAEFAYGFFYYAANLPFTHYAIKGDVDEAKNFAVPGHDAANNLQPSLRFINERIAVLDVPAFNFHSSEIDSLMQLLISKSPASLIIDVRKNTGGNMEGGMRICQYLSARPLYGGVMLSQSYWSSHQAPPPVSEYKKFALMNKASYAWFREQVKSGVEGLCLKAEPAGQLYGGKIYLLTSNQTASAAEPFVYTLQAEGLATAVGSPTKGAVISMEPFTFGNLVLTVPMLEYYTFDGKRLDKVGVQPNIVTQPLQAMEKAMELIAAEK